jgi:hypothetical protein
MRTITISRPDSTLGLRFCIYLFIFLPFQRVFPLPSHSLCSLSELPYSFLSDYIAPSSSLPHLRRSLLRPCAVLFCTVLYCTVLCCTVLYYTVLYCTVLYCTVLCCAVLCCTILYCTVLYSTVLCCAVVYCTVRGIGESRAYQQSLPQTGLPCFFGP